MVLDKHILINLWSERTVSQCPQSLTISEFLSGEGKDVESEFEVLGETAG